jgi:competence protein ComEC
MEVYLVDIGRGTSNLILLGRSRAIVIDCGARSGVLLQLLERFGIQEIVRLIVSHNHDDHAGGAVGVLTQYEGHVGQVCFLQDGILNQTPFWQRVQRQLIDGTLSFEQLIRLECGPTPKELFRDRTTGVSLKIFAPSFADNLEATQAGAPNATSGVLVLTTGRRRVVFAGDSTISQWRRIRQIRRRALDCDLLSVPHHAGSISKDPTDIDWLYTEGVRPAHAYVSVATSNTYGHPRREVIQSLVRNGTAVACSQITRQCCDSLESLRPGVLPPIHPSRSRQTADLTWAGNSRNVACAGTMVAEIVGDGFRLHRFADHQAAVDRLSDNPLGHPLCRTA